jgi:hypothetical protein
MELSSKADHILDNKAILQYKKIGIISWPLSDHNEIKIEINIQRNCRNYTKSMEIEQYTFK